VLLGFRVFLQPKGRAPMASPVLVRGGNVQISPGRAGTHLGHSHAEELVVAREARRVGGGLRAR